MKTMIESITGSCVCSMRKNRVQVTSQRAIPSVFQRSGVDSGCVDANRSIRFRLQGKRIRLQLISVNRAFS